MVDASSAILGDAAAPFALFTSASRYIGTLIFDVTIREVHSDEDTISTRPVETGTPVTHNVFANPQVIEITCASSDSTAGYAGYSQDVYAAMLALKATREPFDVSTGKRFYSNMLFGHITVVTDETSEFALMVTARLQQVILSYSASGSQAAGLTQDNQASPADTAPQANVGTQALQPVTGYQSSVSIYDPAAAAGVGTLGSDSALGAVFTQPGNSAGFSAISGNSNGNPAFAPFGAGTGQF